MTYSIAKAIQDMDRTIENLQSPSDTIRREAAAWAQYAFCGHLGKERAERLIEAVGRKIELRINGHAEPVEPDEYVRERCADALRLALEGGLDIGRFAKSVRLSAERDPHEWVRDRAGEAVSFLKPEIAEGHDPLPLPKAWSTRPQPASPPISDKRPEKQLRA